MKAERLIWWLAMACAVLLIPSWLYPKTVRILVGGGMSIQGWGWQNVASWAGAMAMIALSIGRINRTRVPGAVFSTAVAVLAFGIAAAEAARTWIDLTWESANLEPDSFSAGYQLRPATGMDATVSIAVIGAMCALILVGAWLHARGEW